MEAVPKSVSELNEVQLERLEIVNRQLERDNFTTEAAVLETIRTLDIQHQDNVAQLTRRIVRNVIERAA